MRLTMYVMALVTGLLLIYDAIAFSIWGNAGTVSGVYIDLSHKYPLIPFLLGIVMGHLHWQITPPPTLPPSAQD